MTQNKTQNSALLNKAADARKSRKRLEKQSADYAKKVMPIVRELRAQGYKTIEDIARGLAARSVGKKPKKP